MAEKVNVVIPSIGESVSEGTIGKWFVKEGDLVRKDQPLLEVDSDKATLEVSASHTGKVSILVPAGKTAAVGATVGLIELTETEIAQATATAQSQPQNEVPKTSPAPSTSTATC